MTHVEDLFQLEECLDWIIKNQYRRVVLQLKKEDLKHTVAITNYLDKKGSERLTSLPSPYIEQFDFYVSQSSTCCVDLLVTQHVSNVDAIIHFGKVCLSKPEIANRHQNIPILFVFGRQTKTADELHAHTTSILKNIESLKESAPNSRICILFDTCLIDYARKLDELVSEKNLDYINVANLYCPSQSWQTTTKNQSKFCQVLSSNSHLFGNYILPRPISEYNCAIYLGTRLSIHLALDSPSKLLKINCYDNLDIETVDINKLLNRRMALVGRLKEEEELKIGVIITNPLPNINSVVERLESYSKPRKNILYFISMIQTIDECKIGNFDLCDAFIVINSCNCSTILESLVFNRPIITELEYKLACGFEAEYGRVFWPGTSSHLSEDDMINKRKVSDVSLALIQTRNELLERCSQARGNKWSGLEYRASNDDHESLVVEEGLKGIASSYVSEPIKKMDCVGDGAKTSTLTANITDTSSASLTGLDVSNK